MKKGVTVEFVSERQIIHHIGDGGASVEWWGEPTIKIACVNVPISVLGGDKIGLIVNYEIKDRYIKFEAMVRDTPKMREQIGIESVAGPLVRKMSGKIKKRRPNGAR